MTSLYGIDILADNAQICRERLYKLWDDSYSRECRKECNNETRDAAKHILGVNIVCGNALSMMCVDDNQQDTEQFIIFPEWTFPFNDARIKRRDFRLDVLLKENPDEDCYANQFNLFSDDAMGVDNWMIDPMTNELVPKPVREYPLVNYRRLANG